MAITKEERVLRTIQRKEIDYLPSQIVFADRSRYDVISKALGLSGEDELDNYLENHFLITFIKDDKPLIYRDVKDEIEKLKIDGYANPDWKSNIVYDDWGVGYMVGVGSFFVAFHPLQGKSVENAINFMPDRVKDAVMEKDIKVAVKKYTCPDPDKTDNFDEFKSDLKKYSGEYFVWPSGYGGIYERSYHVLGWEELMTYIASSPLIVEEILDKVLEYKMKVAQKTVELGFKIGHTGDDFGTQSGGFFSDKMFRTIILPRLKKLFGVFKKGGLPVMLHSCGHITQYIPELIDIGLNILEPCQPCMDLNFLKKEYGKDLIFYGGINTQTLPYISESETRKMVKDTIWALGKGGGYIIAPAQEVMNDVPIENIKALVETIREERVKVLS
jgi:uroporphyrinogen decarboxylase